MLALANLVAAVDSKPMDCGFQLLATLAVVVGIDFQSRSSAANKGLPYYTQSAEAEWWVAVAYSSAVAAAAGGIVTGQIQFAVVEIRSESRSVGFGTLAANMHY